MEPNNNQANNPAAEDVTKYIEQNIARMINMPGLRIAVPKPALLGIIKAALKGINIIAPTAEKKDIALQTLAQQVMALSQLAEHGMANSLKTAPPAGISEAMQAFPKGVIPQTAPAFWASPATPATPATPASPPMPGEGVGEDTQSPGTQPTESAPISDTPGTPDEDINENPTAPGEPNQSPQATPTHPNAVSPESANLGAGTPTFNQADSPEQQRTAMPGYAQQEQDKQLAEQAAPDGNAPGQSPQTGASAPSSPPPAAGATQPGSTAGSGLPGVAVPQQAPAARTATPQEQTEEARKQEEERQKAEKANTAGELGKMKNRWFRRHEIKKIDKEIAPLEKEIKQLTFRSFWICFGASFIKDIALLIAAATSETVVLPFIFSIAASMCGATVALLLWLEHTKFKKEVLAPVKALLLAVGAIPFANTVMIYKMESRSRKLRNRSQKKVEKLEKDRHKLVNAKKI